MVKNTSEKPTYWNFGSPSENKPPESLACASWSPESTEGERSINSKWSSSMSWPQVVSEWMIYDQWLVLKKFDLSGDVTNYYNISLTWNVGLFWDNSLIDHDSSGGEQWGRYDLPRFMSDWVLTFIETNINDWFVVMLWMLVAEWIHVKPTSQELVDLCWCIGWANCFDRTRGIPCKYRPKREAYSNPA